MKTGMLYEEGFIFYRRHDILPCFIIGASNCQQASYPGETALSCKVMEFCAEASGLSALASAL